MSERHIPIDIRRKIGVSPGAVGGMWVRFGQDDPLDEPGGYRYEISPEDRKILEQAVSDADSADSVRRAAALYGLTEGLKAGGGIVGLMGSGAQKILNFLGYGVQASASLSGSAVSAIETNDGAGGGFYAPSRGRVVLKSVSVTPDGLATLKGRADALEYGPVEDPDTPGIWHYQWGASKIGIKRPGASSWLITIGVGVSGSRGSEEDPLTRAEVEAELEGMHSENRENFTDHTDEDIGTGQFTVCSADVDNGEETNESCLEAFDTADGPYEPELETLELDEMEPIGDLDPADSDVTPAEMQDMIDAIKDSPYGQDFYEPPVDTQDPSDMPIPAPEPTPEPGAGEIPAPNPISPGAGGGAPMDNFTYDDTIGQSPLAEFGMPMGDDFFDPDTGQLGDAFRPGKPFTGNVGGTPFPGTINAVKPVKPPRGAGGGLSGPGGIPALDPPNADFTGTAPPFYGDTFRKDRCFNDRLVTDVVKILAGELGLNANNIYVTPGCDKRFTGCFKKGSSKFDAMWDLADRCGYGVFPGPGDGGTVEPVTPLPVHHGPYHELVDLFRFEPVYDDFETYAYVEVSRPHYPGKRGYSVVVPVNSVYSVSEDKVYTQIVGRNYPEADAMDRAVKLAENFRRRTMQIECAIPYEPAIKLRHQFRVQRPSYRFNANYMATTVRHDCNHEGYITVLAGTYLTPEESAQYA